MGQPVDVQILMHLKYKCSPLLTTSLTTGRTESLSSEHLNKEETSNGCANVQGKFKVLLHFIHFLAVKDLFSTNLLLDKSHFTLAKLMSKL